MKRGNFTLLFLTLNCLSGIAINPGCRCIRYVSTFGKEWGAFSSPDFPSEFSRPVPCLLYLFSAPPDSIVQLNLSHIHLPVPANANVNGCSDYLKLFLHLETEGVNESTPWNSLICGQRSNETFYSNERTLVLQFHAGAEASTVLDGSKGPLGFKGYFRFLNSSQFESNGRLVPGTKCDFKFQSRNYSSPSGKFFSPYYPSIYPHNTICTYHFTARAQQRIKLVFESVSLEPGVYSCLNKTDIIRVLDGPSSRSPVIALICNAVSNYEILSSGQELLVEFIGNSDRPGGGFRAKFHFIKVIYEDPYDPSRFNLQQYYPKIEHPKSIGEDGQPQASTLVPQCDQLIYSDVGVNGSLSSPSYPNPYQPKSHCRFDLTGHGRQRVQISFVDFHLYHQTDNFSNDKKCVFSDSISAFVYINGERVKIIEHCGLHPPPDLMSVDHRMSLEFNAKASATTPPFRGFYSHYAFVEDFGVGVGVGSRAGGYPCAFIFNISVFPNGTIGSPNFGGLYPRDTECHYFFHGSNEKGFVQLSFTHFDLPGRQPCDSYLETSNFMPTSPLFERRCGSLPNLVLVGGGPPDNFFRLTFRSGLGGEGGGFHANFIFTQKINQVSGTGTQYLDIFLHLILGLLGMLFADTLTNNILLQ